jgi:hypothetical protein
VVNPAPLWCGVNFKLLVVKPAAIKTIKGIKIEKILPVSPLTEPEKFKISNITKNEISKRFENIFLMKVRKLSL